MSARYELPLPDWTHPDGLLAYSHSLTAGFDFKQTDNNLAFGGESLSNPTDVNQFLIEYSGTLLDRLGSTSLTAQVVYSPGNLSPNNKDSLFAESRAFAESEYLYSTLGLTRFTRLPKGFTLQSKLSGQVASGNLLPSEQLNLGGRNSIRGYEENEANGDYGWWISNELRTPSFSPLNMLGITEAQRDRLYFITFWDHGVAQIYDGLEGQDQRLELSSIGAGLRYNYSSYFSLRFDYATQLVDLGFENNDTKNHRMHLGLFFSY